MDVLKKILGILIFVLLGVLIFGSLVLARGWTMALMATVIAFVLCGLIKLGILLLYY